MTNNSLSEDIYAVGQLMADNLNAVGVSDADVDDGLTTLANKILNASGGKTPTILTINLDKTFLEIGERVRVSGRLTDYEGNPIANAPLISHSSHETAPMTTNANGEYSIQWYYGTSAYNHVAHHYVTYAGNETYRDSQSETKDVSFRRTSTLLLETPMITYTDEFDVKGSLTDGLDEPISNATVTLTWNDGSDHTATTTTSNTGGILLHRDAVTTAGTYSFQLSFDGGSRYVASNSSVVNVVPDKEESVMNITSPSSGSTVSSDSVTITGTLKDNDGTAMSGKSVSFSLNNVSAGTATVESDGSFSKTVAGLIAGSNSISASFAATATHTAASQSITVNRSAFDGLSDLELIAGSQILSYADEQVTPNSQYATVETQLTNSGSPALIEGVTVDFYRYVDGVNDVYLDSVDTDSSGQADYTYHSAGIGDIKIYGKVGSFLTKTYSIEDCLDYQAMTDNSKQSRWTIPSAVSSSSIFGYSSNGWKYGNASSFSNITYSQTLNYPFSIEMSLTDFGGNISPMGVSIGSSYILMYPKNSTTVTFYVGGNTQDYTVSTQMPKTLRMDVTDSTTEFYIDDTLIATKNHSLTGIITPLLQTGSNRYIVIKDYKLKPL